MKRTASHDFPRSDTFYSREHTRIGHGGIPSLLAFHDGLSGQGFHGQLNWDPSYLRYIFSQDFEFRELWSNGMGDQDLIKAAEASERYCPVVEDISLDHDTLYEAVAQIENEYEATLPFM